MTNPTSQTAAGADEIRAQAVRDAQEAERRRLRDLKAALPGEPEFALAQYEAGASVEQAKAAFADVLRERNAALAKENGELRKKAAEHVRPGAAVPPVPQGEGSGDGGGESDPFMAAARAWAEEHGGSMRDGMREIARRRPELHRAFLERTAPVALIGRHKARQKRDNLAQ